MNQFKSLIFGMCLISSGLAVSNPNLLVVNMEKNQFWIKSLTVQWWQWAMALSDDHPSHPIYDMTGAFCHVKQRGQVWFLAGGFGDEKIHRMCSVPAGKYIFFPVLNFMHWSSNIKLPKNCASLKANVKRVNDKVAELFVSINGEKLEKLQTYRYASDCFDVFARRAPKLPAFIGKPAATDGYWVLLNPLPKGRHTLHFGGKYIGQEYSSDKNTEYELIVQ